MKELESLDSIAKMFTGKSVKDFAKDVADGKPEAQIMAEVSAHIEAETRKGDTLRNAYEELRRGGRG